MKRVDRLAAVLLVGALCSSCATAAPSPPASDPASLSASEPASLVPEPTSSVGSGLATLPTCLFEVTISVDAITTDFDELVEIATPVIETFVFDEDYY